jgi:hypothetical protein
MVGANPPADDVVLRVVVDGEVAADWTLDDLRSAVGFVEVKYGADVQSGPRFLDVLAASGVDVWETGEVFGMSEGRVIEASLAVSATEVTQDWVLDVTNRGTLKLMSSDLPRQQWVRDVREIRIS